MKKLPKEYIIVEIIPNHSNSKVGFIAQLQALKIKGDRIIERLDLRVNEENIHNMDLLNMISYDKEMFDYVDNPSNIMDKFKEFIGNNPLLIIDNFYTLDYFSEIKNSKQSIFNYLGLTYSEDVFNKMIEKYQLEPSNHLVDLLFEALMFEKENK